MRRPVLQATLAGPIALVVALGLLASGAAHASETVSSAPGSRYTLRIEGVPDSVAAAVCGSDGATDRLWSREELDRVASSLRDALLSLVRYDATVRLTLGSWRKPPLAPPTALSISASSPMPATRPR